jgi:acetyl-CoA C-acetyltransferase
MSRSSRSWFKTRTGPIAFETDEYVRHEANIATVAKLQPVFDKQGTVTAANAASIKTTRRRWC